MQKEPPRKLSVDALKGGDPELAAAVMKVSVWLNGEEQKHCLAYDQDTGTLERIKSRDGTALYDPETESLIHETVTGDIEVRWKEPA